MVMINIDVGKSLLYWRTKRKMTQRQVAILMGHSEQQIRADEKKPDIKLMKLDAYMRIYNVDSYDTFLSVRKSDD